MAWTAPATQTNGTLITAATWNTQIEDNLTFLGTNHNHYGGAGNGGDVAFLPGGIGGAIGIFDAACPSGWTRVSAFDGKFLLGALNYGATGGSDTHTHTVSALANHTHVVNAHTHASADSGVNSQTAIGDHNGAVVSAAYVHNHAISGLSAASAGETSGQASFGTSDASSSLPAYITVVFCKKD